ATRFRAMLPLVAATSFTLVATFGTRRTEDRFLLAQSVFFFPYAALLVDRVRSRAALVAGAVVALAPALVAVASLDATLMRDARYEAERFLAELPAGARVEVYGGPIYLPRL